jgi:urease accessory protein
MNNNYLLRLLQLTDPTLPIGGFSHSAGLETYVQEGIVKDLETADKFIAEMLQQNIHYTDAAFVSLSYSAAMGNDFKKVLTLDDECTAVKLPKETREASQKLGLRLIKVFSSLCSNEIIEAYTKAIKAEECVGHYCIAFGLFSAALHLPKEEALTGFYYNAATSMVTNCVKLIPLGQQDGQKLLFSLHPLIDELVSASLTPDELLLGRCCNGFDIRSMQHEQLYSRLYMS